MTTTIASTAPAPEATRVSGRRFVAHVVDSTLFAFVFVAALLLVGLLPDGTASDILVGAVLVLGLTAGQVAFYVLLQRRSGRTPGKYLTRIRVVDRDGGVPSTGALVKRTVPLIVEYFYVLALIGMLSSPHRQRFGDRWGGTYVVAT
jgi:uncharacterized RDD family membrane protein YckC